MWPTHCVQESFGSEFHPDLNIGDNDVIVKKGLLERVDSYSGFGNLPEDTGLNDKLKDEGISTVYVVGLAYDYCVGNTAADSAKNGYKTYIVMDATKAIADHTTKAMKEKCDELGVLEINSDAIPTS